MNRSPEQRRNEKNLSEKVPTTIPKEIDVRWELPGGRRVWWPAKVRSVQSSSIGKLDNASAVLVYKAAHGYRSSTYRVRFTDSSVLVHDGERKNSMSEWRARPIRKEVKLSKAEKAQKVRKAISQNTGKEIDALRKEILQNREQIDALKILSALHPSHASSDEKGYRERKAMEVLGFLIHRMAKELRRSPRKAVRPHTAPLESDPHEHTSPRIGQTCIRVSADCEQRVFEFIAQIVHASIERLCAAPIFYPSYEMTQLPSEGSGSFSIQFGSFSDLCHSLGILSVSDRIQMMCRYGMSKGEGQMRILGAQSDESKGSGEALQFFVGSSCGENCDTSTSSDSQSSRNLYVLSREDSAWNMADRRYEKPLNQEYRCVSKTVCRDAEESSRGHCFEMKWLKANDLTSRVWSRAIAHSSVIVGKIELTLPCILVSGSVVCDEYTKHLTEEVLRKVVE